MFMAKLSIFEPNNALCTPSLARKSRDAMPIHKQVFEGIKPDVYTMEND
jgi:hypothetical protein